MAFFFFKTVYACTNRTTIVGAVDWILQSVCQNSGVVTMEICESDGELRPFQLFPCFFVVVVVFFYAAASHWHSKLGQHRSRPQSLIVSGLIFILFSTMRHQFPMSLFVSFLPFHHHSFSYFTFVDKSVFFPFFRGREKTQGWHKR